jgi:hypothetical protein
MPEQFVNPSPKLGISGFLFFDFPCEEKSEGVAQVGVETYSAAGTFGNVNLTTPGIEQPYGKLGNPPRDQGHPFIKEYAASSGAVEEAEDSNYVAMEGIIHHDLVIDIDRGIQINHTGRLSGSFVEFVASKPYMSEVKVSAVSVTPSESGSASIQLATFINWLEPQKNAPNVWFWKDDPCLTRELLFTAHLRIDDLTQISAGVGFKPEAVYKLVFQWMFWKFTGPPPYSDEPPEDRELLMRAPISGFDEAIVFEVKSASRDLRV